jgi:hypothetical protein
MVRPLSPAPWDTTRKRRKLDDGHPTAGPSSERPIEEPDYVDPLDLDESVEGSCDPNERDALELEEGDACSKGRVTKKMPLLLKEGCSAAVYDQLHRLPSDTDWWKSYLG